MNNVNKALKFNALLAGVVLLTACNSSDRSQGITSNEESSGSATYAMRGTDNSWPPVSAKQTSISSNLLAPNYYLVVDTSGSMNESGCSGSSPKLSVAKEALKQFVNKLPSNANIGLLLFDRGKASEVVRIGPNNKTLITTEIHGIDQGKGGTPLGTAITAGYESLTRQAQAQLGYGEYHLVVVTDGYADNGNAPDSIVRALLKKSAINLHTIGFCIDTNHALNLPGHTVYKSAGNAQALMDGLDSVLAEAPNFQAAGFSD